MALLYYVLVNTMGRYHRSVRNWLRPVVLLVVGSSVCLAGIDPAAQKLLIAAKRQASLVYDQTSPFELDVNFVAQLNVLARGNLILKWAAKDRWWRRIVMGDFEQIDIRNGDELYTTRSVPFTPISIRDLIHLLEFPENSEPLIAAKRRECVENGITLTCLKVTYDSSKSHAHEITIDPRSHEILSDAWYEGRSQARRERYRNYFDFHGHKYPGQLDLLLNGSPIMSATVDSLTADTFDARLLIPAKGAIKRRQCEDMKRAVPIKMPDPYPSFSEPMPPGTTVSVTVTILADGSIGDLQVIRSAGALSDKAVLEVLKTWKFKPAMCGSQPVVSDVDVDVNFPNWSR